MCNALQSFAGGTAKERKISSFRRSARRKEHFSRSGLCALGECGERSAASRKMPAFFRSGSLLAECAEILELISAEEAERGYLQTKTFSCILEINPATQDIPPDRDHFRICIGHSLFPHNDNARVRT